MKRDPRQYQGTIPEQYRTDANGDYAIMTVKLAEGDWLATTREFKAFGKTESAAVAKLGRFMQEAAESLVKLAEGLGAIAAQHSRELDAILHPTDPPHCDRCGEYGCTKHREATKEI